MKSQPKLSDSPKFLTNPIVTPEAAHSDARGSIIPIADEEMKSAVLIESKKGTVRANHYHKTDWHYCYLLTGAIDYYHRPVGSTAPAVCTQIKPGDNFFTPPMLEHAMVFTEDSTFICLGRNSREQASYEADVVRVQLYPAVESGRAGNKHTGEQPSIV